MARKRFFTTPVMGLRDMPVSTSMCLILSLYCFWMGADLLCYVQYFPAERLIGYSGPMSIMSIPHWGLCYLAAGCVGTMRLFVRQERRAYLVLHLVKMCVLVGWAVAFDLGPASTAQPSYSLVAITSFGSAFIIGVIQRRYGQRPPLVRR